MSHPVLKLIPVYVATSPRAHGWSFEREHPLQRPREWAWVDERSEILPDADGLLMIHEPGKVSPRFAHELYFETVRREDLPIHVGPIDPDDVPPQHPEEP